MLIQFLLPDPRQEIVYGCLEGEQYDQKQQCIESFFQSQFENQASCGRGDPEETRRVRELIGFVDGQTTNPSLIAKNPEIRQLVASGHRLAPEQEAEEYRKIVRQISPLVGDAGVSR